jgi:hypothetical protein
MRQWIEIILIQKEKQVSSKIKLLAIDVLLIDRDDESLSFAYKC